MAIDAALLEGAASLGAPLLRFYSWTEPAATFGYSQKFEAVSSLTHLRPLIRRPTGGGLVPHDTDWTYSVVVPPQNEWYALRAPHSYQRIHEWMQVSFARLQVATLLAPAKIMAAPGQCFLGAEQHDLLWAGKKIAGAAQRRTRSGLLIQGSVQPPPIGLAKADWQKAVCDAAAARWNAEWRPFELPTAFRLRAEELERTQFGTVRFNQRR